MVAAVGSAGPDALPGHVEPVSHRLPPCRCRGRIPPVIGDAHGLAVLQPADCHVPAYTPDTTWTYTTGRLWLSILPGAAAVLGGIMVLLAATRPAAMAGGLVALLGGVWFVVGAPILALATGTGTNGPRLPVASPGAAVSAPVV